VTAQNCYCTGATVVFRLSSIPSLIPPASRPALATLHTAIRRGKMLRQWKTTACRQPRRDVLRAAGRRRRHRAAPLAPHTGPWINCTRAPGAIVIMPSYCPSLRVTPVPGPRGSSSIGF
jgi:hypothetical protein